MRFALALFLAVAATAQADDLLRLATTTSTRNSGLLDQLLPIYQAQTGTEVQVIAVGTGKALRMGQDGDVDLVMVHAPAAEQTFVEAGHGVDRRTFMQNDFIIVGPKNDPAGVRGGDKVGDALRAIQDKGARFISRGDDSGTHKKERAIWAAADLRPAGDTYLEAGQGMGRVLTMASEMGAYTLADRGTWLAYKDRVNLDLLVEGDEHLANPYSIILVNPNKHAHARTDAARRFSDWICSDAGQKLIGDYRLHGEPLFHPLLSTQASTAP